MQAAGERGASRIQAGVGPSCLGWAGGETQSILHLQDHVRLTHSVPSLELLSTYTSVLQFSPYRDRKLFVSLGRKKVKTFRNPLEWKSI